MVQAGCKGSPVEVLGIVGGNKQGLLAIMGMERRGLNQDEVWGALNS